MKRTTFLAAALAATLAWATPSAADTILFDPSGGNDSNLNATIFDWLPGNALLIEETAPTATTPGSGTILFQANLGVVQTETGLVLNGACGAGCWITATVVVDVTLTSIGDPSDANTTWTADSGTLRIYADNERGNNLTGLGFALDPGAVEILEATITVGGGSFDYDPLISVTALDQYNSLNAENPADIEPGGNNYPGAFTLTGTGGSSVTAVVTQLAGGYFNNLVIGSSLSLTNTSSIDPYSQANPSDAFSTDGIQNGNLSGVITGGSAAFCGVGNPLGLCINGTGSLLLAQGDGNTAFTIAAGVVPEPATLTLLGLGLLGAAVVRRRQMSK